VPPLPKCKNCATQLVHTQRAKDHTHLHCPKCGTFPLAPWAGEEARVAGFSEPSEASIGRYRDEEPA
jgi:hypothetical protein